MDGPFSLHAKGSSAFALCLRGAKTNMNPKPCTLNPNPKPETLVEQLRVQVKARQPCSHRGLRCRRRALSFHGLDPTWFDRVCRVSQPNPFSSKLITEAWNFFCLELLKKVLALSSLLSY